MPDTKDARAAYRLSPKERQKGEARLRVGEMLLYCFPGSPTVYYGDEAGMEGFEDPLNRKTYPWDRQDRALLDFFRSLGQLRRHRPSLQDGDLTYVYAQGGALVLRRQMGNSRGGISPLAPGSGPGGSDLPAVLCPRRKAASASAAGVGYDFDLNCYRVDVSRETSTFFIISSVSRETFFSSFFSFCKFSIETARKCDILNKKTDRK